MSKAPRSVACRVYGTHFGSRTKLAERLRLGDGRQSGRLQRSPLLARSPHSSASPPVLMLFVLFDFPVPGAQEPGGRQERVARPQVLLLWWTAAESGPDGGAFAFDVSAAVHFVDSPARQKEKL